MTKIMLIDATHAEETRVAVVEGNRLVDFDYESKVRKQLKSSIFLAKVTRVEPSLQAAFVNFGGNRHGFLPFSEIHPDYFRIPVADREALLAAQAEELERMAREEEALEQEFENPQSQVSEQNSEQPDSHDEPHENEHENEQDDVVEVGGEDKPLPEGEDAEGGVKYVGSQTQNESKIESSESSEESDDSEDDQEDGSSENEDEEQNTSENNGEPTDQPVEGQSPAEGGEREGRRHGGGRFRRGGRDGRNRGGRSGGRRPLDSKRVEMVGGDGVEGDRPFRFNLRRNYKIQEVVKRGQIMLVQVSKEERGNKGAAVTTYLSLPGRYCVLMPNSPRGGGVSRKIENYADRRKMKEILSELSVPEGMSVILRTAGVTQSKDDIKRDLDYLLRLWDQIREDTLKASAPAVIYEEGNLIKRSIRDLYGRGIEDIHVAGEDGFKTARSFMQMLMPDHEENVRLHTAHTPLFHKWRVESQIADIGKQTVTLKSGGYLVINPTEALVSVDVNSGRATKERHIEETAVKTNLEAADEVARQLRLRDLGGLVVIDFIDMEDNRNNRRVESRLRDALSSDRARIQVGRISSFGLLELSRQRLNPSLSEMQFQVCAHCDGVGRVPTLDFAAIKVVRAIEEEGVKGTSGDLAVTLPSSVALYILNNKRQMINEIEGRYGFKIFIKTDDNLPTSGMKIEILRRGVTPTSNPLSVDRDGMDDGDDAEEKDASSENVSSDSNDREPQQPREHRAPRHDGPRDNNGGGRDRNRNRNRGGRDRNRDRDRGGVNRNPNFQGPADVVDPDALDAQVNGNVRAPDMPDDDSQDHGPQIGNDVRANHNGQNRGGREGGRNNRNNNNRRGGGRDRRPDNRPPRENRDGNPNGNQAVAAEPSFSAQPDVSMPPLRATRNPPADTAPKDYEVVNKAPEQKKKGWWGRITE